MNRYKYFDFHNHLHICTDKILFDIEFIRKLEGSNIGMIIATEDMLDYTDALRIKNKNLNIVEIGIGFHPRNYNYYKQFAKRFLKIVETKKMIAEIGLDKKSILPLEKQKTILYEILSNIKSDTVIQFHSPQLFEEILNILPSFSFNKVVFHHFCGNLKELKQILDYNYYISVNIDDIPFLRKKQILRECSITNILTETDYPYCRNKNYFEIIPSLIEQISQITELSKDQVISAILENTRMLITILNRD
ncbi:MAG: TatD family hydrolase [Candidatus Heimdallarchaeaceae archaeon]